MMSHAPMLVILLLILMLVAFAFVVGYEAGHSDGMRCNCEPNQPFWRKWLNMHRVKGSIDG